MGELIEKIKKVWAYLVDFLAFEIMPEDSEFDDSLEIKFDIWEFKSNDDDTSYVNLYGPYGHLLSDHYEIRSNDDNTSYVCLYGSYGYSHALYDHWEIRSNDDYVSSYESYSSSLDNY